MGSTFITITINDGDDLPPLFTQKTYTTTINENFPLTGKKIQRMVDFDPPIYAYDQDKGINASLEYSILQGKLIFLITTIPQYLQLFFGIIICYHYHFYIIQT